MAPGDAKRGGRTGGRGLSEDVLISKALSYTLRHGAQKEGIKIRQDGYVRVDELVSFLFPSVSLRKTLIEGGKEGSKPVVL